jgi:hypothetical protein
LSSFCNKKSIFCSAAPNTPFAVVRGHPRAGQPAFAGAGLLPRLARLSPQDGGICNGLIYCLFLASRSAVAMQGKGHIMGTPRIAVVGSGYWGKNLIRNFHQLDALACIVDTDRETLAAFGRQYPDVATSLHLEDALADDAIEGIVVATPAETHYAIATPPCLPASMSLSKTPRPRRRPRRGSYRPGRQAGTHPHGGAPAALPSGVYQIKTDGPIR